MKVTRSFVLILCSFIPLLRCHQVAGFASVQPLAIKSHKRRTCLLSAATEDEDKRSIALAENLMHSLRKRTSSPAPLNLETDFYDPTTGLHSEGVWHNCLVGMASVKLAELQKREGDGSHGEGNLAAALRIAESLWEHSWDGVSFQRRAWSGLWDHSRLEEGADDPPEQPNYYRESTEHRCIQHGAALLFWSKLVHYHSLQGENELCYRLRAQYKLIAKQLMHEYWDESASKWRTIGKSQGGGTMSRKSASAGKPTAGVVDIEAPYYRAVDQAIGLLACLEMMKDDDSIIDVVRSTCQSLLSDFGYQSEKESVTYIGLERNRNLWHDGWVALALVSCAKTHPDCFPEKLRARQQVGSLLERLRDVYFDGGSGTMWHWPKAQKSGHESGNVRYCGDNALWYAISRARRQHSGGDTYNSFWDFVRELQSNSEDGLVSVADVYPQVRLHPSTELACLVLWSM